MAFMFEKLDVYQRSLDFADRIVGLTEGFPRGYGFLVDQLNRAALSVATNHALYVNAKFEYGEQEIRSGKGVSHEAARQRLGQTG